MVFNYCNNGGIKNDHAFIKQNPFNNYGLQNRTGYYAGTAEP